MCIQIKTHSYRVLTLSIFSVITMGYLLPLVLFCNGKEPLFVIDVKHFLTNKMIKQNQLTHTEAIILQASTGRLGL